MSRITIRNTMGKDIPGIMVEDDRQEVLGFFKEGYIKPRGDGLSVAKGTQKGHSIVPGDFLMRGWVGYPVVVDPDLFQQRGYVVVTGQQDPVPSENLEEVERRFQEAEDQEEEDRVQVLLWIRDHALSTKDEMAEGTGLPLDYVRRIMKDDFFTGLRIVSEVNADRQEVWRVRDGVVL